MKFIVLNRNEKRIRNIETFNTIRKVKVSALDTIEFDTYADFLEKYYRILYKDSLGLWHEYLVLSIERIHDENGIYYHVYLENSLTELRGDFIEDLRASNSSAQNALDKLLSVTRWKGEVSGINPSTTNFYRISAFEGLSKLLTDFGGEITTKIEVSGSRVINRVVVYKNFIGKDLGKRFSFSKDIKSVTKTIEEDDVITALYGYGKSEELENENGESSYTRKISFSELNDGKGYVENTDAKLAYGIAGRHRFGSIFFDDIDNKSLLLSKTKEALEALSKPKVVYEVDVIDLKSYGFDFEGVSCGDFVVIRDGELKESLNARVLELEENLDKEGTTKLVLGSIRLGIADYTKSIKNEVSNLKSKEALYDKAYLSLSKLDNVTYIDEVVKALNDQFNSGTSNAFFDVNRGIVITDKKTEKDSTWIMELSSLGFRIANSKKSNGQWNFSTFGTGDGFTANLIRAGILEGGKVKFDLENGTFNIGDALIWDGENLTLSAKSIKTVVESEVTSKLNDPAIREAFKGDKGDRGLQGIQGIQGLEGPKGDQGIQGPVGKTGATGATGAKGVDGKSSYTHIAYATNQTGITGFSVSDSLNKTYIGIYVDNIATDSSDPSKYKWTLIKGADGKNGIAGAKGADGKTPYFHIAYATNQTGTAGFSVTDSIGKTYIGQYTDYAQADSTDPSKYKWTLIKGDKGDIGATGPKGATGATGATGAKGADGKASIMHFAYLSLSKKETADPYFEKSLNGMSVYNNAKDGSVVVTRQADVVGSTQPVGNDRIKISHIKSGGAPNRGGFVIDAKAVANKVYLIEFTALVPVGAKLQMNNNPLGTGGTTYWLTDNAGTGKFQNYSYVIKYGTGSIGGAGHVSIIHSTEVFDWYVSYYERFDITDGFAFLPFDGATHIGIYSDYASTQSSLLSKYHWALIKGEKGEKGDTGATGAKGATGATGTKGTDGVGLKSVENQYALSDSKDVMPTSGWSSTALYEDNKYLWRRLKLTYTNGSIVYVGEEYVVDPNTIEDEIFEITTKLKTYTDKTDEHITSIAEMNKTITNLDGEIEAVSKTSTAAKQTADSFSQEFTRLENALSDNEKETKEIKALIKSGLDANGNTYTEWGSSSNSTVRVGANGIEMVSNKVSTMVLKDGVVEAKALNVSERIGFGNHTAQKYKDEFTIFSWTGGN